MTSLLLIGCSLALAAGVVEHKGILVRPEQVLEAGFEKTVGRHHATQVVVLLEDGNEASVLAAGKRLGELGQSLHVWIEVGWNPRLADEHPEWMASLGVHDDWRKRFPDAPRSGKGQVVKAYPWVPIWYRSAFDKQLTRVGDLLAKVPGVAGVYLSDIQAGPASCGCGNDQCRWAVDYKVTATAAAYSDPKTPAEFLERVRALLPGKPIVPVWCVECEREDQLSSNPTTGRCGSVPCFQGLCWREFAHQFTPIVESCDQIAIPAFQAEWNRTAEFQQQPPWIAPVVRAVRELSPKWGGKPARADQIVVVVEGWGPAEKQIENQIRVVQSLGVRGCIVALTRINQSWEPRLVDVPASREQP